MGFLSDLVGDLFGGTDDSAQDAQIAYNERALDLFQDNKDEARRDALRLFPGASDVRRAGYEEALNLLSGVIPQQFDVMNQGRQQQQETLLRGHNLYQNALLGLPSNVGTLRRGPLTVDTSIFDRGLPQAPEFEYQAQPYPFQPYPFFDPNQFLGGIR